MSTQNFYLKQISCLQNPVNNQGWHEISELYPALSTCLIEAIPKSQQQSVVIDTAEIPEKQAKVPDPLDDPIPWCPALIDRQDEEDCRPFQLKSFVYDCSYLSPFIRPLYSREQSKKGWYRWVGPEPALEIRLPLAPAESESWLFTATFHSFLDETHAKEITFEVNGKRKPLEWVEGSVYQSRISSAELYQNAKHGEAPVASLSIAVPEARQASEQDQRVLAFAISELALYPA